MGETRGQARQTDKIFKLTPANTEGKGWKFICVSELSGSVQKVPVCLEATDATHTRGSLKEETWTYRSLSVRTLERKRKWISLKINHLLGSH